MTNPAGHDAAARWGAVLFRDYPAALAVARVEDALRPLSELEKPLVDGAVAKRVAEFRLGRHCAHAALRALGIEVAALLRDEKRAPTWPSGVTGAITHGAGVGAAAVIRTGDARGLGLDIERESGALPPETWRMVFTEEERARLGAMAVEVAAPTAHIWFSLKESAFKAAYGAWRIRPPLLTIAVDLAGWTAPDRACGDLALRLDAERVLRGAWLCENGRVVSRALAPVR